MDGHSQIIRLRTRVGQLPRCTSLTFYVSRCIGKVAIRYGTEVNLLFLRKTRSSAQNQLVHIQFILSGNKTHLLRTPLHTHFLGLLILEDVYCTTHHICFHCAITHRPTIFVLFIKYNSDIHIFIVRVIIRKEMCTAPQCQTVSTRLYLSPHFYPMIAAGRRKPYSAQL